ncbi:nucleoid-associated protein [Anaerocolumna aminovalerica]|uniref:nucleoid-associated protein n=1 Tax=Anaerocolumna aminovalerica TaxID=1527 RepID=UPI001C0F02FC|nr:nucleoid-associated protein [Anaerocolumna aminovalerica]MBU5331434.1 nucleoid-associated protein [Anaerocolumna aminovalerica]
MEKDEIIIRNAIMHVLNTNCGQLEFSDTLLELSPDINDFLRNHIYKIISSDEVKQCDFQEESEVYQIICGFSERDLIMVSQQIAYRLYEIMYQNIDIPAADLFTVTFQVESQIHMALIKMNYKESLIHSIEKHSTGISNTIRKQRNTLPGTSSKPTEAAIINLHDYSLKVIEKKYEVNGIKTNYFSELFLTAKPQLSTKTKLNLITRALDQVNRKYFEDDFRKTMETKAVIYQENINNGSIKVEKIAYRLYGDNPEIINELKEKLEKHNLQEGEAKPQTRTTIKKFENQILSTNHGIQINIPMEQYLESRDISLTTNTDGTFELTIKNIDNLLAR